MPFPIQPIVQPIVQPIAHPHSIPAKAARVKSAVGTCETAGNVLLEGNFIIGIAEGLAIAYVFRIKRPPATIAMVLANYFSAWTDFVAPLMANAEQLSIPVRYAFAFLAATWILSYGATILLEFPFILFVMRKQPHRFRQSLYASLMAQTASYAVWTLLHLLSYVAHDITVLPGDLVLVRFNDEICVFDFPSRKLGTLAFGYAPVVLLAGPPPIPNVPAAETTPHGNDSL